ncbi:hypothetical protein I6F33_34350 [Bradyrhizobium sp. BRP20]|uniref:hypothetical protein n=1 Tax=Bradyrhizobium sp. BRP20 TaxID=2793822 RepID=UPI001CD3E802|nr:hypothetical protein [Bradyrhizobium sp. BRP20]MCA1437999.1 hypothetical protein [Bradyrhizobium sp. BRP20]
MKHIAVASTAEIRRALADLPGNALFRGQVAHYEKNGIPSVVTSFDRKGCIPSEMVKWCQYASNVLEAFIGDSVSSLDFTQALLQHYGWRSFFVDCSASAAVSSWFASHVYSERERFDLCEDYEERAVMLLKRMAHYDYAEGDGHLYVFDRPLSQKLVGVTDLAALKLSNARARTEAQSAWLLGPLNNAAVPLECFVAHIRASRSVFRDYASEEGFLQTDDLFPSTKEDPILRALLGLPWKRIDQRNNDTGLLVFRRALELPEYQDSFIKIASASTAFFQGARAADRGSIDGCRYGGITVAVPEVVLFGTAGAAPLRFPKVQELLAKHRSVVFEVDELIQHPAMRGRVLYQKGIAVTAHEPDLIELSALLVEHPGLDMTAAGLNRGWFYRVGGDGAWKRESHPDECDCGNEPTHLRHISSLHIAEHHLASGNLAD